MLPQVIDKTTGHLPAIISFRQFSKKMERETGLLKKRVSVKFIRLLGQLPQVQRNGFVKGIQNQDIDRANDGIELIAFQVLELKYCPYNQHKSYFIFLLSENNINLMFNYFGISNAAMCSPEHMVRRCEMTIFPERQPNNSEEDYQKLMKKCQKLQQKCANLDEENKKLKDYIFELEELFEPQIRKKKEKVKRRKDSELNKQHSCPYLACRKEYASELALSFHIRMKHNGGTKTERVAYVRQALAARQQGRAPPPSHLNLPAEVIEYEIRLLNLKFEEQYSSSRAQGSNVRKKRREVSRSNSSQWSYEE